MSQDTRRYRAICFDLDGTLLPMDIDEFMTAYFGRIGAYMEAHGLDRERFMAALKQGTKAMATHDGMRTNEEAFWDTFFTAYGTDVPRERLRQLADDFYDGDFAHIGDGFVPNPAAGRVVEVLAAKGYPLALTTMPMFPRRAVEHRLAWAGVRPEVFARITSYENSRSVKPKQTYYAENLAALGVAGKDVVMVGNNTMEDLSFLDLGADGYLVCDCLLDPIGYPIDTVKHGSFADFEAWASALPSCAAPADTIQTGAIAPAAMERALVENAVATIDLADAQAKAAAVADAVAGDHAPGAAGRLDLRPGASDAC